jgi:hypothetical protein
MWSLWSRDREVDSVAIGLFFGAFATAGTVLGLLVRMRADAEPAPDRVGPRRERWTRWVMGVDAQAPERPATTPSRRGSEGDRPPADREERD